MDALLCFSVCNVKEREKDIQSRRIERKKEDMRERKKEGRKERKKEGRKEGRKERKHLS